MLSALAELRGYGYLFRNFVVRDISSRYKGSTLGVVWSLLNPLLMMVVYTVVFDIIFKQGIRHFPVFFLAGFLPWYFFSTALVMGTSTIVGNAGLVQKVYFPREVLPLSMTTANLVNTGIAFAIFLPFAAYYGGVSIPGLVVLIPVTVGFFLFTAGLTVLLAGVMVYFRDVEFLLGIALMVGFYMTPIVYSLQTIAHEPTLQTWISRNPMVPYIEAFRDAFYRDQVPGTQRVVVCLGLGIAVWIVSYAIFLHIRHRMAEEL